MRISRGFLRRSSAQLPDALAADNYVYLGVGSPGCSGGNDSGKDRSQKESNNKYLHGCYTSFFPRGTEEEKHPSLAPPLRRRLDEALRNGQNAVIVNECIPYFSMHQIHVLATELNKNWNVKLILTYRRLFDFLPSMYNQRVKPTNERLQYMLWPGERAMVDLPNHNIRGNIAV